MSSLAVSVPPLSEVFDHYGIDYYGRIDGEVMVLCPGHSEDRPSCSANMDKGVMHCHACGFKGGVMQLIMRKEGIDDFATALQFTKDTFGESYGEVSGTARSARPRLSGRKGSGFKPKYRNSPLRGGTFPAQGS